MSLIHLIVNNTQSKYDLVIVILPLKRRNNRNFGIEKNTNVKI